MCILLLHLVRLRVGSALLFPVFCVVSVASLRLGLLRALLGRVVLLSSCVGFCMVSFLGLVLIVFWRFFVVCLSILGGLRLMVGTVFRSCMLLGIV